MDTGELLARHDEQLRGGVPEWHPVGVVVEADGPVVRRHYGTHGTAEHVALAAGTELDALVRRQLAAFEDRCEPSEWKVYGHDSPGLGEALTGAGFTAGPERSVLAAPLDAIEPPRADDEVHGRRGGLSGEVHALAAASGPHRTSPATYEADGVSDDASEEPWADTIVSEGRVVAAGWAELVHGTEFVVVGGLSRPEGAFVRAWAERRRGEKRPRYLLAEAEGALREELGQAGLREITTVRSYRWTPPGTPEATRPALLVDCTSALDRRLWDRFYAAFDFKPSVSRFPGISEPTPSATWHAHGHGRPRVADFSARLDDIVRRGLIAVTEPGESVFWLDWNHDGYRYDPRRTGIPGRPPTPGEGTYPNGDYYLHLTEDMRLGTFGHPWEQTLCVFGPLLAAVEAELTELLGEPLRRRDG
ncbi:DUF2716 domain-containing protein [Streptomyces sp. NBC_00335]|uniref:DUF2716 domain-containing protein n=1 Tax=unclassified Streptomyces TaxID=2593676 RepID=UPI00224FC620|nr:MULTISPECIES: DUF2716 domain-containing protein [unclassified Streptomyces]MCX5404229.1 DUF2716 domain-containing protein [Streptomyces sp. NBC_00086]